MSDGADLLAGLRVLEVGDGVAGSSATSTLWSLGAEVTAVIDPASTHRRGRPHVDGDRGRTSLLATVLDRGKRLLTLAEPEELAELLHGGDDGAPFDVVVVDRVGGVPRALAPLGDVGSYTAFVEQHRRGAWLTISAFGLSGARAADIASDLTVAAASGMLASVRDPRTGRPLKLAGQQALLSTGQAAALAACHAFDLASSGQPAHLDLAAVEAMIAMGPVLEVGSLLLNGGVFNGAKRYGAPASFYECVDGLLRISAMEDHQWQGVVRAMGSPAWAPQFDAGQARIERADEVDEHVAAWAMTLTKSEAEAVLQSQGVPATAMRAPLEILDCPQLAHRGAFEPLVLGDGRVARIVGSPYRVVSGGNGDERAGERRRRSLRGLRLLEAGHVLAAPLGGAILAALGVEVTKLEDLRRLDMYRRRGPYVDGEDGADRSVFFALVNHSKQSAAFDVDADRLRLDGLVEHVDVVLENLGAKRASAMGIAASSIADDHPGMLSVSSSGFGQDGPYAGYRAYAYNLQASCAIGYLTRNIDGEPAEIDLAWADLISAFALATVIAAWAVGPAGNRGVGIDFAMADLSIARFNDFLAAASLDPDSDRSVDRDNELAPCSPHGVYPTADGWVAVSVDGDLQFAALAEVLRLDPLAVDRLARGDDRWAARATVDDVVADGTRHRAGEEVAAGLRAAGVVAEVVIPAAGLLEVPQLVARDFFTGVEHPEWGHRRLVGIPWRPVGGDPIALGPPPVLAPG